MPDDAVAEERVLAQPGPIDELMRKDDVRRRVLLLHRADCARRKNRVNAEEFEAVDVRAVVQLGRQLPMSAAVARQKRDPDSIKVADQERIGRVAEWRVEFLANNQPDIVVRTMVSTLVKTGLGSLKPRFVAAA